MRTNRGFVVSFVLGLCSAFSVSQAANDVDPNAVERARVHGELAAGYIAQGNLKVALKEAEISKQADPNSAIGYSQLGLVYMLLEEMDLAQLNLAKALKLDPTNPDYNNNYGYYLCLIGQIDKAYPYLLAAARDPLYATPEKPYYNAGTCAIKAGDAVTAESYFSRALKRLPDMVPAIYQLALLQYKKGDFATAYDYAQKLAKLNEQSVEVLWLSVRIARKMELTSAADSFGAQLTSKFPESKETAWLAAGKFDD